MWNKKIYETGWIKVISDNKIIEFFNLEEIF